MKKTAIILAATTSFLFIQSCTENNNNNQPGQVDFTAANVQGTWSIDKITDYDFSDNQTGVTNVPDGYYDWTFGTDDTLRIYVTGSLNAQSHYQLGTHLGKNIIITDNGSAVDSIEITSITANSMEFNNKLDVTATTSAGEYEKYNISR